MAGESGYWNRAWERRLTRRRAFQAATVAGSGLGIMAAGCGGKKQATTGNQAAVGAAGAAKQPKKDGSIVHAGGIGPSGSYDSEGTGVDPHTNTPPAARGFRLASMNLL